MDKNPFQEASEIIERLEKEGYEAYFVGGCVRDLLLQRKVEDIDIATSASPPIVQQTFQTVIPVGIEHGTVIVRHKGKSYEVTTFRRDGSYSDQRHPDEVTFVNDIAEDMKRRDFTINALALDKEGKLIDLFQGEKDLEKKVIRSVGDAKKRFQEDPLRIIRALRFASQLGFSIEKDTLEQMMLLNKEIETVAVERLTNEFTKFFQGEFLENGFSYLLQMKGYRHIPILNKNEHLIEKVPRPLSAFYSFSEVIALFHYLDSDIAINDWVKEWKCSNQVKAEAINLFQCVKRYEETGIDSWLIYRLDRSLIRAFSHLAVLVFRDDSKLQANRLSKEKDALPIQSRKDLHINGHDLIDLFPNKKQGPWMNEIIEQIEYKVVMGQLANDNDTIKEWIICHPPAIN